MILERPLKILSLLSVALLLGGCSLDATLEALSQEDLLPEFSEKASYVDLTPSSSQGVRTNGNYEAQVSVSYYDSQPEVLTPKGYTVQTNLQSTLFKE